MPVGDWGSDFGFMTNGRALGDQWRGWVANGRRDEGLSRGR